METLSSGPQYKVDNESSLYSSRPITPAWLVLLSTRRYHPPLPAEGAPHQLYGVAECNHVQGMYPISYNKHQLEPRALHVPLPCL